MASTDASSPVVTNIGAEKTSSGSTGLTAVITVLNVAVFCLMALNRVPIFEPTGNALIPWGANYGPLTLGGQWWRLGTSLFLHFGLIHLAVNMIVLARIGPFMEALVGRSAFAVLYLLAGLGGGLASLALHPWTVSAGASGAIFGLYGGLFAFLLRHRNSLPRKALKPLLKSAVIFVGYNLLYGMVRPEIDISAHMGGLIAAFLGTLLLAQPASAAASGAPSSRAILTGVLGLALMAGAFSSLPEADDFSEAFEHMTGVEAKSIALYNDSVQRWKSDQLKDEQLTALLENQLLPPWRAERESFAHLKGISAKQKELESSLVQYMQLREDSWSLLAHGVRTGNLGEVKRSSEKSVEADKVIDKLGATVGK